MTTTKDSFDATKNYQLVSTQVGQPVLDFELNEQAKILLDEGHRLGKALGGSSRWGAARFLVGSARRFVTGYSCVESNEEPEWVMSAGFVVKRGSLWVDGVRLFLADDLDLVTSGAIEAPATPTDDTWGVVYVRVALTEIGADVDPDIATMEFGETARRGLPLVTWHVSTSTVSRAAALAAITAPNDVDGASYTGGQVMTCVIADYFHPDGAPSPTVFHSRVEPLGAEALVAKLLLTDTKATWDEGVGSGSIDWTTTQGDAVVGWCAETNRLTIGARYDGAVASDGFSLRARSSVLFSPEGRVIEPIRDTGGILAAHDWATQGFELADGQAIGFLPLTGSSVTRRASTGSAEHFYVDSTQSLTARVETLHVGAIGDFGSPGAFIVAARVGRDLHWWTGKVTRGSRRGPITDTPFPGDAKAVDVVLSGDGATEVASSKGLILATKHNKQTTTGAARKRSVSGTWRGGSFTARIRRGVWSMDDGSSSPYKIGSSTELAVNHSVHSSEEAPRFTRGANYSGYTSVSIKGDSKFTSKLEVPNFTTFAGADFETAQGSLVIAADEVRLEDLTLELLVANAADARMPVLTIYAHRVTLKNLHVAHGNIRVFADIVHATGSDFETYTSAVGGFAEMTSSVARPVAGCLSLRRLSSTIAPSYVRWTVKDCTFKNRGVQSNGLLVVDEMLPDSAVDETQASVTIDRCHFDLGLQTARWSPGVGVHSVSGDVNVTRCTFRRMAGHPLALTTTFTASLGVGDPMTPIANATTGTYEWYTWGYVSMPTSRGRFSATLVEKNKFDLRHVGVQHTAPNSQGGGALLAITGGYAGHGTMRNVRFTGNTVYAGSHPSSGWTANAIWQWGAYFAPSVSRRGDLTSYLLHDVEIDHNKFDTGTGFRAWQGMGGWHVGISFPQPTGGIFYHGSCMAGVALQAATGYSVANRFAHMIGIHHNKFGSVDTAATWQAGTTPEPFTSQPYIANWRPTHMTPVFVSWLCSPNTTAGSAETLAAAGEWGLVASTDGPHVGKGTGTGCVGVTVCDNEFFPDVKSSGAHAATNAELLAMVFLNADNARVSNNTWRYLKNHGTNGNKGALAWVYSNGSYSGTLILGNRAPWRDAVSTAGSAFAALRLGNATHSQYGAVDSELIQAGSATNFFG